MLNGVNPGTSDPYIMSSTAALRPGLHTAPEGRPDVMHGHEAQP
jgi:2-keto-3-deoxy-galactonokinase